MACIFLKGEIYRVCLAYNDTVILSLDELKKFCDTPHYHLCPVYQRFQQEGIKVPIQEHARYKVFTGA